MRNYVLYNYYNYVPGYLFARSEDQGHAKRQTSLAGYTNSAFSHKGVCAIVREFNSIFKGERTRAAFDRLPSKSSDRSFLVKFVSKRKEIPMTNY